MERATLKPAEGLLVWLEDGTGHLPAEGQSVPLTSYYRRRLADGDVIDITSAAPAGTVETEAAPVAVTDEAEEHA